MLIIATLSMTLIAGFINAAPSDSGCALINIMNTRVNMLDTCIQRILNGTNNSESSPEHIESGFYRLFQLTSFGKYKGNLTDTEKSQSVMALLCFLKTAVKQNPSLGVMAYDCSDDISLADSKQYLDCFLRKVQESCANAKEIRKRSVNSLGEEVMKSLLSNVYNN